MNQKKYLPFVWFVLGFGIFMSTRASNFIPHWNAAIVIAPIFVLTFGRSLSTKKANLLTLVGFLLSFNIALWGLFDLGDAIPTMLFSLVRSSAIALIYAIPYMADRAIYPKLQKTGVLSTLSFPIASTAVFFLISLEGPFDGDMITAVYYGYGNLVFKQIASIAGLFGFVFVFSWLASVINYAWEKGFKWGQIKTVTISYSFILLTIFLFGAVKTSSLINPEPDTVKVAAIFLLPEEGNGFDPEGLFSNEQSPYEETISKIEVLTEEAALNGTKIVAFQETAIKVNEKDEIKLIEGLTTIAVENDVYFSLGYGVFPNEGKGWNKAILISNQGEMGVDYRKRYLFGMGDLGETLIYNKGPEVIQSVDTPYGRIGVSICRDMSFPPFARQAGEQKVDIMLNPSYDMPQSHGPAYSLRTIENGFSMVRPVYNGYSYAVDFNGSLLAGMGSDNTETGIMYADVPTKGVNTIYATIGDLLGWLCVLGLGALSMVSIRYREGRR